MSQSNTFILSDRGISQNKQRVVYLIIWGLTIWLDKSCKKEKSKYYKNQMIYMRYSLHTKVVDFWSSRET